jgi:hypothetical protein
LQELLPEVVLLSVLQAVLKMTRARAQIAEIAKTKSVAIKWACNAQEVRSPWSDCRVIRKAINNAESGRATKNAFGRHALLVATPPLHEYVIIVVFNYLG